ncbi:unnamed protein product [Leptosia nina]|uniref:S-adenosylmethionine sensor upstream of mTORC1 n=1 Tax=Leptosia nina TaxID=320188 RepID=A0AAV1J9M4_9NEOP
MASDEHKELAEYLKKVHADLRASAAEIGSNDAWALHCKNEDVLRIYANYMKTLATTHWEKNCASEGSLASSRISWSVQLCDEYFNIDGLMKYRERDIDISNKLKITLDNFKLFSQPLKLLDVGSCYNPFKIYCQFDVTAVDLCPANEHVLKCDFLKVNIGMENIIQDNIIYQLQESSFDIITFCFLLEYLPSSELRVKACETAYKLLRSEGLLVITTPDSKHVGANAKLMKCWQYTLACLGYTRIKYEKLAHMHCMGFRKALHKDVAARWAILHKKNDIEFGINIPQDHKVFNQNLENKVSNIQFNSEVLKELPFCNL